MLLAIDVGNTSTVFGLFGATDLTEHWRVATERHQSGDELGALYRNFLDLGRVDGICSLLDGAAALAVVPGVRRAVRVAPSCSSSDRE